MENNETKNELIKRYEYLYDNKDYILALCITMDEDEKCYLNKKASNEVLEAYEEFLFTDMNIDTTTIYKYIESLKYYSLYYASMRDVIENLEQRRKSDRNLAKAETFTVWKILTYVRNNNLNNKAVLDALDRYYNIDRYMFSGKNYTSGYELNHSDQFIVSNNDYPSMYPNFNFENEKYYGNEYEEEDEYYDTCSNNLALYNKPKTIFMSELTSLKMLSEEDKQDIYFRLNGRYESNDSVYRLNKSGWYQKGNDMLLATFHFHIRIKQVNNDGFVYHKIIVHDNFNNEISINFYTLQEAVEFTETVICECEDKDEIMSRYRKIYNGYSRVRR